MVNAIYPHQISSDLALRCEELIRKYNLEGSVKMVNDYLSDVESMQFLSVADMIVYPYQQTNESSSAAIRHGLASNNPVFCTQLSIFNDVSQCVNWIKGFKAADICNAVMAFLNDVDKTSTMKSKSEQERWIKKHEWNVVSRRMANIIRSVQLNKPTSRNETYD